MKVNKSSDKSESLMSDGNDLGPAPLQNIDAPLETFEGLVDTLSKTKSSCAKASLGFKILEQHVNSLKGISVNVDNEKQAAIMKDEEIFQKGNFVNMNTTQFSWARAFPTIFIPTYLDGKWVILHDITGSFTMEGTHDKHVGFKEWLTFMMFRSDGVPASHPTFSLVAHNHKMKDQLQCQGQYILNTSNMDPNISAKEVLNMWDDKESGRKQLFNRLNQHSSNIIGTDSYWVAQQLGFQATTFLNHMFIMMSSLYFILAVLLNIMSLGCTYC